MYESIHFDIYDLIERRDVRRLLAALWYSRWQTAAQIVDGLKEITDPKTSKILLARLKHRDPLLRTEPALQVCHQTLELSVVSAPSPQREIVDRTASSLKSKGLPH